MTGKQFIWFLLCAAFIGTSPGIMATQQFVEDYPIISYILWACTGIFLFMMIGISGPRVPATQARKNRKIHVSNDDFSNDDFSYDNNIKKDTNSSTGFTMLGAVDSGGYARGDSPSSFEDYSSLGNNMFDDWK